MAYRNVGERLGDVMQNVGAAYPQYAMQQQQMKRLGENDAFNQDIATQRLGLAQASNDRAQGMHDVNMTERNPFGPYGIDALKSTPQKPPSMEERFVGGLMSSEEAARYREMKKLGDGDSSGNPGGLTPKQWVDVGGDWADRTYNRLGQELSIPTDDKGNFTRAPQYPVGPQVPAFNTKVDSMIALGNMPEYEAGQRYQQKLYSNQQQGPVWTNDFSPVGLGQPTQQQQSGEQKPSHWSDEKWQQYLAMKAMEGGQ